MAQSHKYLRAFQPQVNLIFLLLAGYEIALRQLYHEFSFGLFDFLDYFRKAFIVRQIQMVSCAEVGAEYVGANVKVSHDQLQAKFLVLVDY